MYQFITLLRSLATLLVIHSHCDRLLPIPALATGGSIGDSLFFIVSGFCLYHVKRPFLPWLKKRLLRIYPAVWMVSLFDLLMWQPENLNFGGGVIHKFIFPTDYSFITAILLCYLVLYPLMTCSANRHRTVIIVEIVLLAVYLVSYFTWLDLSRWSIESGNFKLIYWMMMFFGGCLLASCYETLTHALQRMKNRKLLISGCIFSFFLFYLVKVLLGRIENGYRFQGVIHLIEIIFLTLLIVICVCYEETWRSNKNTVIWKVITFCASITLENYLIMDRVIARVARWPFPVSYILAFVAIFFISYWMHRMTLMLTKRANSKRTE